MVIANQERQYGDWESFSASITRISFSNQSGNRLYAHQYSLYKVHTAYRHQPESVLVRLSLNIRIGNRPDIILVYVFFLISVLLLYPVFICLTILLKTTVVKCFRTGPDRGLPELAIKEGYDLHCDGSCKRHAVPDVWQGWLICELLSTLADHLNSSIGLDSIPLGATGQGSALVYPSPDSAGRLQGFDGWIKGS
jgi:hypothetical protein